MKPVLTYYGILAMIGGAALVLSLFFGVSPCIVYHVLGVPCPACGLTRAFVSLARFDVGQAFRYHPLFIFVPLVPFIGFERLTDKRRNIIAFAALGIFVAVWVVRMVMFYPDTPPMTFNEYSLLGRLMRR